VARLDLGDWGNQVAFSPDGKYLVSATGKPMGDGKVSVWDWQVGREIWQFPGGAVNKVAWDPAGRFVAAGRHDGKVSLLAADDGRELRQLQLRAPVVALAVSPRGDRLIAGSVGLDPSADHGEVVLWETGDWRELMRESQDNLAVGFSQDGRQMGATAPNGAIGIWDAATGRSILIMQQDGEPSMAGELAFAPDGSHLATALGGSLRIWNLAGEEVARREHRDGKTIWDLAFSPDGRSIATGSADNTAAIWLWQPADLIADACARLPRNLTRDEWDGYVGKEVPYHPTCSQLPAGGD
jgi:WD40 repeat protein